MERTNIGELQQHIGETVKIQGWLQKLRDQKHVQFLVIRDRTAATQVVMEKSADPDLAAFNLQHRDCDLFPGWGFNDEGFAGAAGEDEHGGLLACCQKLPGSYSH